MSLKTGERGREYILRVMPHNIDYNAYIGFTLKITAHCNAPHTSPAADSSKKETPSTKQKSGDNKVQIGKTKPLDPNSAAETEKAYGLLKDKADLTDARYCDLQLKSKKQKKTSIMLSWSPVKGAASYIILGAPTGKPLKRLAVKTGTTYTHSGLKKGTYYKYAVVACRKAGGTDQALNKSKVIYVATKGGKAANVSKIKLNKKKVSLKLKKKKKKTFRIKAKTVKKGKK